MTCRRYTLTGPRYRGRNGCMDFTDSPIAKASGTCCRYCAKHFKVSPHAYFSLNREAIEMSLNSTHCLSAVQCSRGRPRRHGLWLPSRTVDDAASSDDTWVNQHSTMRSYRSGQDLSVKPEHGTTSRVVTLQEPMCQPSRAMHRYLGIRMPRRTTSNYGTIQLHAYDRGVRQGRSSRSREQRRPASCF